jgi:leucine-zipper of insertion element IS481
MSACGLSFGCWMARHDRVCREFGNSCQPGYKIFDRHREHGLAALSDRSRQPAAAAYRRPHRQPEASLRNHSSEGLANKGP